MPGRKHKNYKRPKRPFDAVRIQEENVLIKKYGLKNKREIWKADSAVRNARNQAKLLLTKNQTEQDKFVNRLRKQGFIVASIADVLALDKEDYLKRRLQSVVVEKKIATTPRQARQFIVHKNISIDGKKINVPSYLVPVDEEDKIKLELVKKIKKEKEEKINPIVEAVPEEKNDEQ